MIRILRLTQQLFRNCLLATALFLPWLAAAATYTTDEKAGRALCEIFLAGGFPEIPKTALEIPLGAGSLPFDIDSKLLFSREEVENYLRDHSTYPWRRDLELAVEHLGGGSRLIYLAEFGPTLWGAEEFAAWAKTANGEWTRKAKPARQILLSLAKGETVDGISPQAAERVRNSFLARAEFLRVEGEFHIRQIQYFASDQKATGRSLYNNELRQPREKSKQSFIDRMLGLDRPVELPPDPLTGKHEDLSRFTPGDQKLLAQLNFRLNGTKAGNQAAREMREHSPSLRLPWESDFENLRERGLVPRSIEDLQSIDEDGDVLWIMRTLIREELVRRRVSEGHLLGTRLSGDDLFFLAAYPELVSTWRQAEKWRYEIRHEKLGIDQRLFGPQLINERSEKPELIRLEIERELRGCNEKFKPVLSITNTDCQKYDCNFIEREDFARIEAWFKAQWAEFEKVYGVHYTHPPRLVVDSDGEEVRAVWKQPGHEWALIQFFAYLFEKYPTVTSMEHDSELPGAQ